MKRNASLAIGAVLTAIAVCFVVYAAGHPEASFPNRYANVRRQPLSI